jgi:hypothetical protein
MSLGSYLLTLLLTLLIELSVAYIFGYREKRKLIIFLLVNIVTHPLLSYFLWINSTLLIIPINYFSIIILEIAVVLVESLLLHFGLKDRCLKMFKVSLLMNAASFVLGLLIFS